MDAIFFVLRTECSWNALNETGIGFSRCTHCRFPESTKADVRGFGGRAAVLHTKPCRGVIRSGSRLTAQ
jgi:hypothetical protein